MILTYYIIITNYSEKLKGLSAELWQKRGIWILYTIL